MCFREHGGFRVCPVALDVPTRTWACLQMEVT